MRDLEKLIEMIIEHLEELNDRLECEISDEIFKV